MPATPRGLLVSALLALGVAVGGLAACTSAERPVREPTAREPAVEETTRGPSSPAPVPTDAEAAGRAEIEAERRMEEAVERVPVAESLPPEANHGVLEVRFDSGAAALTEEARASLDAIYDRLLARTGDFFVDVQGHTDPTGNEASNRVLAEQRAEAVRAYLHEQKGVPLERMDVTAHGSAVPVANNLTPDGRERNRRVVVVVLLPP